MRISDTSSVVSIFDLGLAVDDVLTLSVVASTDSSSMFGLDGKGKVSASKSLIGTRDCLTRSTANVSGKDFSKSKVNPLFRIFDISVSQNLFQGSGLSGSS